METEYKICPKCRQLKEETEFYTDKSDINGIRNSCKKCDLEYAKTSPFAKLSRKNYKKRNFEKLSKLEKQRKIFRRYNLTEGQYLQIFINQDYKCLNTNCRRPLEPHTKNTCVDHDHKTGIVRGLLCQKCNVNLGWYENNKSWIESFL